MDYIIYLFEIIWTPFVPVTEKLKEIDTQISMLERKRKEANLLEQRKIETELLKLRKKRDFWN